jgi:arylformamidase
MAVYDISLPISESLVTWPGDPRVQVSRLQDLQKGDAVTVSQVSMGVHTGTHIDAPAHYIRGGAHIEALDLNILIGPALVVETGNSPEIGAALLDSLTIPETAERLLFHTSNSKLWMRQETFSRDFVAITEDGAAWLTARKIRLVGVDYLSVAPFYNSMPTHHILLAGNTVILEGLNLHGITAGPYQLVCLPLKLVGCEGAPARAVLLA